MFDYETFLMRQRCVCVCVSQWRRLLGGQSVSAQLEAAGPGSAGGGRTRDQTQQWTDQRTGTTRRQQRFQRLNQRLFHYSYSMTW